MRPEDALITAITARLYVILDGVYVPGSPENVVEDIKYSIDYFHKGVSGLIKDLWITDDNFFANRDWAIAVLNKIIDSGIKYRFNIQARYTR